MISIISMPTLNSNIFEGSILKQFLSICYSRPGPVLHEFFIQHKMLRLFVTNGLNGDVIKTKDPSPWA